MTLKKLPNFVELSLIIRKFISSNKNIWDIGIYGSFIKGKADIQDLDVVIFLKEEVSLNKKIELSYSLKKKIEKNIKFSLDIKAVSINDFFDKTFLARQGIISESFLIKRRKYLSELFGFKPLYLFTYTLNNLPHSKKILFNYALKGRGDNMGILKERNASPLGISSIITPIDSAEYFKDFFSKHKIKYKIIKVLTYP